MYAEDILGLSFLGAFGVFVIFVFIIPISVYIINALALMKIAEGRGNDKGWLAWVPLANSFVIPMLIEDDVHESLRGKFMIVYGVAMALTLIPFIGFLFVIVLVVLAYYAFYVLVNQYTNSGTAYLLISIFTVGLAMPILLFRIRNREATY